MSPRFVPATVHELSRVGLLAGLPGEKLTKIAQRMEREEVPPGRQVVREGDDAERFYVILSGLFTVSQEDLGPRRVLQPGSYFGEVGLAMNVPRTASVRALTAAVVASCDRATFDELLRPLFARAEQVVSTTRLRSCSAAAALGLLLLLDPAVHPRPKHAAVHTTTPRGVVRTRAHQAAPDPRWSRRPVGALGPAVAGRSRCAERLGRTAARRAQCG